MRVEPGMHVATATINGRYVIGQVIWVEPRDERKPPGHYWTTLLVALLFPDGSRTILEYDFCQKRLCP